MRSTEFASYKPIDQGIDVQAVTDYEHGHYQIVNVGWRGDKRVHNCIIHIDIQDNKILIQENRTDIDIANQLVEMGVPKKDIVLALQPPDLQPFTGFGLIESDRNHFTSTQYMVAAPQTV